VGGIIYINTHGNTGRYIAITFKTRKAAEAWVNAGTDNADLTVVPSPGNGFIVRVYAKWLARNYQPRFNMCNTIVFADYCYSENTLPSLGGRIGFGYSGCATSGTTAADVKKLLERMNGLTDSQEKRIAADAIAAGGYSSGFKQFGNKATTLCPSVKNPCTANARPWGPGAGRSGRGQILFDTALSRIEASSPSSALTATVVYGTVTVDDFQWHVTGEGFVDGFTFRYRAPCKGKYKVLMRAVAKHIVPYASTSDQRLDGNDGKENQTVEGKANNKDDFVWSFED
jgi:hypothetical protein